MRASCSWVSAAVSARRSPAPAAQRTPNNIFAALGSLLSEGRDVNVPAGTPLAVEIEQPVSLRGRGRIGAGDANTIYTATERIRDAQRALAQRKYYPRFRQRPARRRHASGAVPVPGGRRLQGDGQPRRTHGTRAGVNIAAGLTGAALSADVASTVRRDAQSLVSRLRAELGSTGVGPTEFLTQLFAGRRRSVVRALGVRGQRVALRAGRARRRQRQRDGARRSCADGRGAACRCGAPVGARLVLGAERVDDAEGAARADRYAGVSWELVSW